jgi:lipoprotein-anchoring transpeptidase ErfK/SrfK
MPIRKQCSLLMVFGLIAFTAVVSPPANYGQKKQQPRAHVATLTRAEAKQAQTQLAEMGYGQGPNALIAFQKYESRQVNGKLNREEFEAITRASAPKPRDPGYKHVEVDLDRQVLLLIDENGDVRKVLPVSTGSNRQYHEKGMSGLAYTPRGRFKIYAKIAGWRESPLGMLYYPNYFSDGLAIHGNSSVPDSPESHGCIRVPNSAAPDLFKQLPVGTIVLIYDKLSFVPAKDWVTGKQ